MRLKVEVVEKIIQNLTDESLKSYLVERLSQENHDRTKDRERKFRKELSVQKTPTIAKAVTPKEHIVKLANERREELIQKQTQSEKLFKAKLKALDIKYDFQKIVYTTTGTFYILDFFLPEYKLVVELDGGYHSTKDQRIKDSNRTFELRSLGFNDIKRLSNEEAIVMTEEQIKFTIEDYKYKTDRVTRGDFHKVRDRFIKDKNKRSKLLRKKKEIEKAIEDGTIVIFREGKKYKIKK